MWELYGPDDWTQSKDLAAQHPEKLRELQQRFLIEGTKYNVLPIDDRQRERYNAALAGRPDLMAGRTTITLLPGMTRLNENTVVNVKNRSFRVISALTLTDEPANGAVIAQGGGFGGWNVYFKDGHLTYAHNWLGLDLYRVRADSALGAGKHVIEMRLTYDGGGTGKGADVELYADGDKIGEGRVDKTVPAMFSLDEGTDVGLDSLDAVVPDYGDGGGRFNGTIEYVTIDASPDGDEDPEMVTRARMRKQ